MKDPPQNYLDHHTMGLFSFQPDSAWLAIKWRYVSRLAFLPLPTFSSGLSPHSLHLPRFLSADGEEGRRLGGGLDLAFVVAVVVVVRLCSGCLEAPAAGAGEVVPGGQLPLAIAGGVHQVWRCEGWGGAV